MIQSKTTVVDGLTIHYLEAGAGDPVLLVHGWPTSSFLWRNVIPHIARTNRVIALDLPGFGKSDKPLDQPYTFRFFAKIVGGFLKNLNVATLGLAVHDLGGPVGLFWACNNMARVSKLAILNTIVYPEMSWAVKLFILGLRLPLVRSFLVSPAGLRLAMKTGLSDARKLTEETVRGAQEPFAEEAARQALIQTAGGLNPKGFFLISERIKQLQIPVRVLYGADDRILPDMAETARRLQNDLPQAEVTSLPDCGHFLQEERPDEVGRLLGTFFGG